MTRKDKLELLRAVREADQNFEQVGGGSKAWLFDCFLPTLAKYGFSIVRTLIADNYHSYVGKRVVDVLRVPNWFILVFDDGQRLPYPDVNTMAIEPRRKVQK